MAAASAFDRAPVVEPEDRAAWRAWLHANHDTATSAWLVLWRPGAAPPRNDLDYVAAVEEALCFGWVDSRGGKLDERRTRLYFARRKPRSGWAATNKERAERLIADGRMTPAGMAAIERAKADGSWAVFDAIATLEVPDDLAEGLAARPPAREHWDAFPPFARAAILGWIALARRPETRAKRVEETAARAQRNERADQWQRR
jgi:uncharacterized protein YdeI (YjbR/CyaY-like superfamily)